MSTNKLPTENECKSYVAKIADDIQPKEYWENTEISWVQLTDEQLTEFISFCQGGIGHEQS